MTVEEASEELVKFLREDIGEEGFSWDDLDLTGGSELKDADEIIEEFMRECEVTHFGNDEEALEYLGDNLAGSYSNSGYGEVFKEALKIADDAGFTLDELNSKRLAHFLANKLWLNENFVEEYVQKKIDELNSMIDE